MPFPDHEWFQSGIKWLLWLCLGRQEHVTPCLVERGPFL